MKLTQRVAVTTGAGSGIGRRLAGSLVGSEAKARALPERLAPVGYWNLLKKAIAQ
jgi:NAD(P)-dependent dehydrogenase (short-subunit alcohol dehydrogenase family)